MKSVRAVILLVALVSNALAQAKPDVQLVWGADQGHWAAVETSVGSKTTRTSLGTLRTACPPLASSPDAEALLADLDADGVGDLAIWSRSASWLVTWPRWQTQTAAQFEVMHLRCVDGDGRNEQLCWATSFAGPEARYQGPVVTILRDGSPHQTLRPESRWPDGLTLLDVDQDGHRDLVIPNGGCTGNCRVSIWPYSAKLDRFVRSPTLAHLANVQVVDPKRRLIESRACRGQACAVFDARLLKVRGTEGRVVATATQSDLSSGSLMKRLRVRDPDGRVLCSATIHPSEGLQRVLSGDCARWPLLD